MMFRLAGRKVERAEFIGGPLDGQRLIAASLPDVIDRPAVHLKGGRMSGGRMKVHKYVLSRREGRQVYDYHGLAEIGW